MGARKIMNRGRTFLKEKHTMNPKTVVKEMKARRESKAKHRSLEEDWGCITSNALARGETINIESSPAPDTALPNYEIPKPATPPPPYKGEELTTDEELALDRRDAWIREVLARQCPPKSAC
jgi:hypothetical protein